MEADKIVYPPRKGTTTKTIKIIDCLGGYETVCGCFVEKHYPRDCKHRIWSAQGPTEVKLKVAAKEGVCKKNSERHQQKEQARLDAGNSVPLPWVGCDNAQTTLEWDDCAECKAEVEEQEKRDKAEREEQAKRDKAEKEEQAKLHAEGMATVTVRDFAEDFVKLPSKGPGSPDVPQDSEPVQSKPPNLE